MACVVRVLKNLTSLSGVCVCVCVTPSLRCEGVMMTVWWGGGGQGDKGGHK